MSKAACYEHPGVDAVASCHGCLRPICQVCTTMDSAQEFCPKCAVGHRRRKGLQRFVLVAVVGAVLVVSGGAVAFLSTRPRPGPPGPPPPPRYGAWTPQVDRTRALLDKEPCDRKAARDLTEALLKGDAPREVVSVVDAFVAKCGSFERLQWDKYTAHKRLSEYLPAGETAGALMALNPTDYDYPWWRGEMYAQAGKLEEAVADYRFALSLLPRMRSVPFMLTDALVKLGRPCEAEAPLETYLFFHPQHRDSAEVMALRNTMEKASCDKGTAEGSATYTAPPGATSWKGQVRINGKKTGTFIIDTGATSVVVTRAFANALELTAPTTPVRLQTAGGARTGHRTTFSVVESQGAKARFVEAVIVEDELGADGLLGLSFLSRFEVSLDPKSRKLTVKSRK
jgi:clan AA aspartic protease (TIGR02281 family)